MKVKLVKLPPCTQIQEKKKTQENNISKTEKDKCHVILFICEIKINKLTETEIGFVVTRGGG